MLQFSKVTKNKSCFLKNHLINLNMKKYILTIKYDENTDNVEWVQEELIEEETIGLDDVSNLTSEDMQILMKEKGFAKA